jgi:D-threo-aldose 1-dehydrogenase
MKLTNIAGTNLLASKVGYGTSKLHHIHTRSERLRLLSYCYDLGINYYDTARMYGDGCAESSLSDLIKGRRSKFIIATKFGINSNCVLENFTLLRYPFYFSASLLKKLFKINIRNAHVDFSFKNCERSVSLSLKALRTDYVDILHMHEPTVSDLINNHDLIEFLVRLKRSGVVRNIGISGEWTNLKNLVTNFDGIFDVIQLEDSILHDGFKELKLSGFEPSVTFGYFRDAVKAGYDPKTILNLVASRIPNKHFLFSSTNFKHIDEVVSLFG